MPRITPLGRATATLGAAALLAFPMLGWHELLSAGTALATMTLAAMIMSFGGAAPDAELMVPRRRVAVGDTVTVHVHVANPGRTRTARLYGDLRLGDAHERMTLPALSPGRSRRTEVGFAASTRCVMAIGPLTVRKGDPFGLARHERRLSGQMELYVHPPIVPLRPLDAGLLRGLEGRPDGDGADDDLDFRGLREYVPGDDVRDIHWPSTAKTGVPMVRLYEADRRTDTSLSLSVDSDDYSGSAEFELAVSIHASIGVRCLIQSRPVTTHAGGAHDAPKRPPDLLDACSRIAPHGADGQGGRDLAREALAHAPDASLHILTVGSLRGMDDIRRMATALRGRAATLVLRAHEDAAPAARHLPGFALVTVGRLDDLPSVMGVFA